VPLVEFCRAHGFRLIDAQQETPHLASLGARPIPRSDYLMELNVIRGDNTLQGNWGQLSGYHWS
jgi:Leu/Phe-tRNA-protein transferase